MSTIEQIVKENGATIELLRTNPDCNWCWGKGWIDFDNLMEALPYFRSDKWKKLKEDLEIICCLHDICLANWGNIIDY